jgi:hypothetical protein
MTGLDGTSPSDTKKRWNCLIAESFRAVDALASFRFNKSARNART